MNLWVIIGVVVALALYGGGAYLKGRSDGSGAARIAELEDAVKTLKDDMAREEAARKADAAQALQDRKDADLDSDHAKELFDALEDPDGVVFSPRDADGLRNHATGQHKAKPSRTAK